MGEGQPDIGEVTGGRAEGGMSTSGTRAKFSLICTMEG